ncbi:MAG: hypothetical protein KZQ59_12320 [Candidatus Thiodiazotropha sp. (ex Lucinoma aequizonata)]|nr:hypothetical protein [Candidatus Thiodiazotropha sp. (ex Lucinoma aequizonata)]MCU7895098.1 hypothetical protein [Candidatus Thiodiazotropha sp. (ex Lucinoma aequizonata)]MCU7910714.1 hypothetical protein [Candidatus Thiodiazotropha sp. (ex Lucinoma aequizonata)]
MFLLVASPAKAGTGAGGIIKVINQYDETILLQYRAAACFPYCESVVLPPGYYFTYGYNWGVTTTWVTIVSLNYSPGTDKYFYLRRDVTTHGGWTTECVLKSPSDFNCGYLTLKSAKKIK